MAVLAFTISLLISMYLWLNVCTGAMPWLGVQLEAVELFACLASLFLPLCVGFGIQILQRKPPWSKPARRMVGAWLVGATVGLVVSVFVAIFGPHDTAQFHAPDYYASKSKYSSVTGMTKENLPNLGISAES